jgi:phospholipid/cholesterol/gamma-HCH transport system substrate-binding protein
VLIVATGGLTWFVMTTSKDKFGSDNTFPVNAHFSDAAGIRWKTRVQINGIDVGKIDKISHVRDDEGRLVAEVKIRLLNDYPLYSNAKVRKASESLLGDMRLDLDPGGPQDFCSEQRSCQAGFECKTGFCVRPCARTVDCPERMECTQEVCAYPQIKTDGTGRIYTVQSVSDMDAIQSELKAVAHNVNRVTESMAEVFGGAAGQGSMKNIMEKVEQSMASIQEATAIMNKTLAANDDRVNQIIKNIEEFSKVMSDTVQAGGDVKTSAENVARLTGRLDEIAASINSMMESQNSGDASVRNTVEELNKAMTHVSEIARKVDEGEGALGQLINDRSITNKIEETVGQVSDLVAGISSLQMEVEWRSQYEVPFFTAPTGQLEPAVKNILGLRIKPKPDKYYIIEVISDPRGKYTRVLESKKTVASGCTGNTAYCTPSEHVETETTTIAYDDLKFSAQFAKRFYFLDFFYLTLRFGIIENTGGVGMNLHFLDDSLEFRFDMFDFSRRTTDQSKIFPRLRATAMWRFPKYFFDIDHIGIQAGFDDPFNEELRTWFVGGALTFTDEDLKMVLAVAPSP